MAAPAVAAQNGGATASSTSHSCNLPASISAGDLLVLCVSGVSGFSWSTPTGWTLFASEQSGPNPSVVLFYRAADGLEGSTVTVTCASAQAGAHTSFRITNAYSGIAPVGTVSAQTTTTNPDPPAVTPGWGTVNTLWIAGESTNSNTAVNAYPSGYANGRSDGTSVVIGTAYKTNAASSEDPGTFTLAGNITVKPFTFGVEGAPVTFSILDTMTLTETSLVSRGAAYSQLETMTLSDFNSISNKWERAVPHSSTMTNTSLHSSSWTPTTKDASSMTNQTKN